MSNFGISGHFVLFGALLAVETASKELVWGTDSGAFGNNSVGVRFAVVEDLGKQGFARVLLVLFQHGVKLGVRVVWIGLSRRLRGLLGRMIFVVAQCLWAGVLGFLRLFWRDGVCNEFRRGSLCWMDARLACRLL